MRNPVVCTVIAFGLGLALASLGCGGAPSYVSGGGLASMHGLPDNAPCNDLEQLGAEVDLLAAPAMAPKAVGGTIEDGTYVLTRSTLYTKDSPAGTKLVAFGRITMVVAHGNAQLIKTSADGKMRRTTVKRTTASTVTTSHTTCASPTATDSETAQTEYSATKDTIQFITPGPAGTVVATYTRL